MLPTPSGRVERAAGRRVKAWPKFVRQFDPIARNVWDDQMEPVARTAGGVAPKEGARLAKKLTLRRRQIGTGNRFSFQSPKDIEW